MPIPLDYEPKPKPEEEEGRLSSAFRHANSGTGGAAAVGTLLLTVAIIAVQTRQTDWHSYLLIAATGILGATLLYVGFGTLSGR